MDNQRLQTIFLNKMVKRESRILAARKRYEAIVVILTTMLCNQALKHVFPTTPIDRLLLEFELTTDVANAIFIKLDGLICFWQTTFEASTGLTNLNRIHSSNLSFPGESVALSSISLVYFCVDVKKIV